MRYTLSPTYQRPGNGRSKPGIRPLLVPRGRDALRLILRAERLAPGDRVLLPAFGCRSLADAVIAMGLEPVFYPVGGRLEADAGSAARLAGNKCRAVLYINYFGFPQGQGTVDKLRETGLALIEDATHSLFSEPSRSEWDYRFASLRKLLPAPEGCLVQSRKPLGLDAERGGILEEAGERRNSFMRTLGLRAAERYRKRPSGFLKWLSGALFYRPNAALETGRPLGYVSSLAGRALAGADAEFIREKRRENYLALARALPTTTGLSQIFPSLPEGACPVSLPVRTKDRELWRSALATLDIESSAQWPLHPAADPAKFPEAAALAREILVLPVSHHLGAGEIQEMARLIGGLAA